MTMLLPDAIREMRKYSDEQSATDASGHASHLDAQMQVMKK